MCSLHRELPLGPHFAGVSNLVRALPVAAAVATLQVQSLTEPPLGPEGGGWRLPGAQQGAGGGPAASGGRLPGDHP